MDNLVEWARCNQTEFYRMLARLMPREIHADVNAGYSLVELLQEIDEREAKHEEWGLFMIYRPQTKKAFK